MRLLISSAFLLCMLTCLSGQNLIGYRQSEIRNYMKENRKDMSLNKVNNDKFIYLKYSDSNDSQTMLFFLNADSVCESIRIVCDEATKIKKLKEFNSEYRKNGENSWIDTHNSKQYLIEIKDEKWASIINMKPLK